MYRIGAEERLAWVVARDEPQVYGDYHAGPRPADLKSRPTDHVAWPNHDLAWPGLVREVAEWLPETDARTESCGPDTPASDAADPDDELFLLGERCAEAYMKAEALHYQAMVLLGEFHRREGWRDTGFSSTAEWLAWRIGIRPGAARERVRTALALAELPETSEAMRNGEISFTKVRALTRVATPETESTLLEFARAGSAANLERVVRGWKTMDRRTELAAEQIRHRRRRFSAFVDDDGMVVVRGRLDPEAGALLMRAVEAASDALFREEAFKTSDRDHPHQTPEDRKASVQEVTPEQRRADALGLLAERALAAGFGSDDRTESGSRADRYQVMLHVDEATLKEEGKTARKGSDEPGLSELEDGTRVSPALRSAVSRPSHSTRFAPTLKPARLRGNVSADSL